MISALKSANDILKFAKNRPLIASKSSPEMMWWFYERCECLSKAVAERCPKAPKLLTAQFPSMSVVQVLPRHEVDQLINRLQDAGHKALTGTLGQLTHKEHKLDFIAAGDAPLLEILRKECWQLVGMLGNVCPGVVRKQIR
ncbi:hypothetical protein PGT21_015636 [Puccinia graminis f. sp. tritici]|uniref:Uncharacterized protein n=1 Tax=Puccinia graminis f. sp. tritici TaxID=56615 RepID=A0A5B0LMM2_PUCGR|nr:hypothetical protein PGTUg99_021014 [Puccinia graminis f. sp. tritici]KAA1090851.1 hypothetical protein PGT21_015636 [Puccinia graminis f. sp. tritici]